MENFFVQKKKIIIEIIILVVFLAGIYFLYRMLSVGSENVSRIQTTEQILGASFMLFLKTHESLSFSTSSMNAKMLNQLVDYSQIITPTDSRGRADPFSPYAATRSVR